MNTIWSRRSRGEKLAWDHQLDVEPADVPFVDDLLTREARLRVWSVVVWILVIPCMILSTADRTLPA